MKNRLLSFYSKLKIRKKITLPFVISFVVLWLSGTSLLGIYFSRRLAATKQELVQSLASLVADSFEEELQQLRQQARLIAANEPLVAAIEAQDITALRQKLLPLNAILEDDWIGVYANGEKLLLDLRQPELNEAELSTQILVGQVLSGADVKALIGSENQQNLSLLVGTAPLKSDDGIVGGILLGRQLSGSLLNDLSRELRVELIALKQDEVIAHSFQDLSAADLEAIQRQAARTLTVDGQRFFQARVSLEGLGGESLTLLMLRERATYERSLLTVWVTVGLVGLGGARSPRP
ncbi:MAG: hypothetical protein HC812_11800 [Leptolyngbya sp. RL_3_1]|nr:hypothetical protein [Leptolyngbya sp. RL_3_1]